jgi:drug/metabolite transporter (DMT)-like permease
LSRLTVVLCTALALVAFAANSILCRLALRGGAIDAASFSTIRFASGAVVLLLLTARTRRPVFPMLGSWPLACLLALYALPFAFAYTQLSTGTGALILFGSVQTTMVLGALGSGERPHAAQWAGLFVAIAGLVYLLSPGLSAPPLGPALLMAVAGASWGIYSLRGRGADPLARTAGNFVRSAPLVALGSVATFSQAHADAKGISLALASGIVASGLGYVAWYAALRGLTAMRAAVVQLAVPLIAAAGGVLLLSETVTLRLVVATILVLGGIIMTIPGGRRAS